LARGVGLHDALVFTVVDGDLRTPLLLLNVLVVLGVSACTCSVLIPSLSRIIGRIFIMLKLKELLAKYRLLLRT